ncbi:hypothetical protein L2E82_47619 [Cichorium intybus]|uniref:Uncharacterized protein n=1 Tax=Cichorium intybus TaxID=13427 RepID=A0ACB8YX72_CICIN|nr:hypothetical protein L2E82_47619 [Cichorium intybus]
MRNYSTKILNLNNRKNSIAEEQLRAFDAYNNSSAGLRNELYSNGRQSFPPTLEVLIAGSNASVVQGRQRYESATEFRFH